MATDTATEQLTQLERNEMIVAERDNYRIDFAYANRQSILNGKSIK